MRAHILLASTVVAGAVAPGTITSTASAYIGCINVAFSLELLATNRLDKQAVTDNKNGLPYTAAAEQLLAWQKITRAPVPCFLLLHAARTHVLNGYADYWRAEKAAEVGNTATWLFWFNAGNREMDQVSAAYITATG